MEEVEKSVSLTGDRSAATRYICQRNLGIGRRQSSVYIYIRVKVS